MATVIIYFTKKNASIIIDKKALQLVGSVKFCVIQDSPELKYCVAIGHKIIEEEKKVDNEWMKCEVCGN